MNAYVGTIFDLHNRTAIVSGGAGLLGREFCKALASAGANIVLADNDEISMDSAEKEIRGMYKNSPITKHIIDVTNEKSISECVMFTEREFGNIDILVNSAAIDPKFDEDSDTSSYSSFAEFPIDLWNKSTEVNLTGTFLLTQAVCRNMERRGKGSVINLGSNYGLVGPDQGIYKRKDEKPQSYKPVVYSVCKAGIIGFTKYLAAYYAGTEIRVNVLTPSGVYNKQDDFFVKNYASRTILRRMSNKNEFWGGVIFLASDASSYMTGGNLIIDGGWTAW
ncbi:SDR family oxidoreductase [candidate division KSB1 bacterium]|nr:SDR family oxidoreductase [candidate division KSB1 bacterium]